MTGIERGNESAFPRQEYAARVARVRAAMAAAGVDARRFHRAGEYLLPHRASRPRATTRSRA
ncbi:MAG: hypothetical protein WDN49_21395 [Acetobacteraceae bacterium]